MSTKPTKAERDQAFSVIHGWTSDAARLDAVAQALADQRARYETVADELDDPDYEPGFDACPDYWAGRSDGADRIRQVAR